MDFMRLWLALCRCAKTKNNQVITVLISSHFSGYIKIKTYTKVVRKLLGFLTTFQINIKEKAKQYTYHSFDVHVSIVRKTYNNVEMTFAYINLKKSNLPKIYFHKHSI